MDSTYIYFQSSVTPSDALVPNSAGVALQRMVTTVAKSTVVYLNGVFPLAVPTMGVSFNGSSFSLSGAAFNVSLGNVTNPVTIADVSTVPILIKDAYMIAFSGSLGYTPQLTPQNLSAFVSLTIPSSLSVSQTTNISVSLTNYSVSSLGLTLPIFFSSVTQCCLEATCSQASIASCSLSNSSGQNQILLILKNAQVVSGVVFTVRTVAYQTQFSNSTAVITTGLPSAQFSMPLSVTVTATALASSLTLGSWMVNAVNTYTLYVQPLNQTGQLGITLPSYILSQLSSESASYHLTINGSSSNMVLNVSASRAFVFAVTPSTTNITLVMTTITNPMDSQPFSLVVEQSVDSTFGQIYGGKNYLIAMTQFDPITVFSATRNETKVGLAAEVVLNITGPSYSDSMLINFPASQIVTGSGCSVSVGGVSQSCTVVNASAIRTGSLPGNAVYTVGGLYNQLSFTAAAQYDQVRVTIGNPYTRASTVPVTTTFVDPKLTLGSISLTGISASSSLQLSTTRVSYNFTIENTLNVYGFIFSYAPYFYYLPSTLACSFNGQPSACSALDNNSLLVRAPSTFASNGQNVVIDGLVNYV
jgi:hypothetical protein